MKKICCFAGHSKLYGTDEILRKIISFAEKLITEENVSEFWVGNYGAFDGLSGSAVRMLKEKYPYIEINLVIPYVTSEINDYKEMYYSKYDNILTADIPENTPKHLRILKCNQYMVKKSQFMICYVKNNAGGAAKTLGYAKKQDHIKIFNLAD